MDKSYDSQAAQERWYDYWREHGWFKPESAPPGAKKYSITIPPPNVTGSLHMGHALCYPIQDILGRWKRMQGFKVLILPGTDHAGIGTQNVVEKEIALEGLTRNDLGRERFVERVWAWKERYGARIIMQLQRLGCAFDWSRERFTMDDDYADAVQEQFIRFFDAGMIYRGARVVNWCPRCRTAISDIEVEYVERDSHLWHVRYPFADGSGEVIVATTRPETMLGDTAVAVNPDDDRYKGLIGKMIALPLVGREIPLIADSYASMDFGTGAVKVTPAHDLNDFEAGLRHHLPQIVVIDEDARMTAAATDPYAGLTRERARDSVVHDLEQGGYLVQVENYRHSVGTCERCHTIIEPLLSEQWFLKMAGSELIDRVIATVQSEQVSFVPERYERILTSWLENIRDWCISRQLWWGHRIPIYYAPDGRHTAARSATEAAARLGLADTADIRQDEDVLDTWFSSDLWPFATMGWPKSTADLAEYYPTDVLVTDRTILYLWVSRMLMAGLEFMDNRPFDQVHIYATVLDKQGRRMSKSLGNGIDPLEMIEKYGADALRFSLIRLASKGQDIRFSEERIAEGRNFCTKIWNAARFVLMNLESETQIPRVPEGEYSLFEKWILAHLEETTRRVNESLASYDLDEACWTLYEFVWNKYCDWFLEICKPALRSEDPHQKARAQYLLWHVLETAIRLLHPIMPFITEEIWQAIPHNGETIMYAPYPSTVAVSYPESAKADLIIEAIGAIRNARHELGVATSAVVDATIVAGANSGIGVGDLEPNSAVFTTLVKTYAKFSQTAPGTDRQTVVLPVAPGLDVYLSRAGLIDLDRERARLESELAAVDKDLGVVQPKLANEQFMARAAADIVEKNRRLETELLEKRAKLVSRIEALGKE